jgi:hypothetical protein
MHQLNKSLAGQAWAHARKRFFWTQFLSIFKSQPLALIDFKEVQQRMQLGSARYLGVEVIPVSKIVGSLGRYQDFVQGFLPSTEAMSDRWQAIARLYLDPNGSLPPIEVYKVADAFFVKDGNHRVSVANELGVKELDAHIYEYHVDVIGLAGFHSVEAALLETERQAFLEKTGLDRTQPSVDIRLTELGGYNTILGQIMYYQYVLSQLDGEEMSFEAAAGAWYTMLYESIVQVFEETGILDLFPDRTAADLYIWLTQHLRELQAYYGEGIQIEDVARDLESKNRPGLWLYSWRMVRSRVKRTMRYLYEVIVG